MDNILFEDVFDVQKKDPDGKKFDKGEPFSGTHDGWGGALNERLSLSDRIPSLFHPLSPLSPPSSLCVP